MNAPLFTDPEEAILDALSPLLAEVTQEDAAHEASCQEVYQFIVASGGPFELPLSMKVSEIHNRWEDWLHAASRWKKTHTDRTAPLREELSTIPRGERSRRGPLNAEIARLTDLAERGEQCVRVEFSQAQRYMMDDAMNRARELLAKREPKLAGRRLAKRLDDAIIHFNELWSERCYLELTWKWTLEKCLTTALFGVDPSTSPEKKL